MVGWREVTIKDVAFDVMEGAYNKVSGNGRLPAHARQIMYAARPEILKRTGKDHLDDQYFTQTLLPDYMAERGVAWNVVYDARGHFKEPHTNKNEVPLGTLHVRKYLHDVRNNEAGDRFAVDSTGWKTDIRTKGPHHRFSAVLFIEKEGFMPLFEEVRLAERYDIAIMSTKGMSNVASRDLANALHVPLLWKSAIAQKIRRLSDSTVNTIPSTLPNERLLPIGHKPGRRHVL
jgi:hypothetical protein